ACAQALKEIPTVNAEIDGADIVYKNYYHVGVAVGTEKGLVVPVVRECDKKSLAEIEKEIADLGRRARDGTLKIEEMQGGTFRISYAVFCLKKKKLEPNSQKSNSKGLPS